MAKKHLEKTKTMFASGVVTKADVLRSELDVAKAELSMTQAKSALEIAKNSFNLAVGRRLDEAVDLNEGDFKIDSLAAPDYNGSLAVAYRERPEWRMAALGKEIADKQALATYSGYLP